MKRQAPDDGYDFPTKRQYRRTIWRRFAEFCGTRRAESQALLMPSSEGDEIDVALSHGFRQENLHVVDRNPAIVATLKRRYPRIQTYGVDFQRAVDRIEDRDIRIDVANFDLCGPMTNELGMGLVNVGSSQVFDGGLVAVTMLRGRERPVLSAVLDGRFVEPAVWAMTRAVYGPRLTDRDINRAQMAQYSFGMQWGIDENEPMRRFIEDRTCVLPIMADIYRSTAGNLTMLWVMFYVMSATDREAADRGDSRWALRTNAVMTPRARRAGKAAARSFPAVPA